MRCAILWEPFLDALASLVVTPSVSQLPFQITTDRHQVTTRGASSSFASLFTKNKNSQNYSILMFQAEVETTSQSAVRVAPWQVNDLLTKGGSDSFGSSDENTRTKGSSEFFLSTLNTKTPKLVSTDFVQLFSNHQFQSQCHCNDVEESNLIKKIYST